MSYDPPILLEVNFSFEIVIRKQNLFAETTNRNYYFFVKMKLLKVAIILFSILTLHLVFSDSNNNEARSSDLSKLTRFVYTSHYFVIKKLTSLFSVTGFLRWRS